MTANRQVLLTETPQGKLAENHFRFEPNGKMPEAKDGELLLKTKLISLDAANRAWMQGATYRSAVEAGTVMAGGSISEVMDAKAPGFAKGDIVFADTGWQDYAAVPAKTAQKLPKMEPLSHLLSVYGIAGLTAYFGLLEVGKPKAGETVVVSAAAGSVGSIVGQIAKIKGCNVIGIAGGAEKCKLLTDELGFDAAIDYKAEPVGKALRKAAPKGIDVYFDNVGGDHLTAAIEVARPMARFAECGMIAQYNETGTPVGPHNIIQVVGKQLKIQGFIVSTHADMQPAFLADMAKWIAAGQMKFQETVMEGIDKAPDAFIGLFSGANTGKMLVKLG